MPLAAPVDNGANRPMTWMPDEELRLLLIDDDDIDGQLLRIYLAKISHRIDFTHCMQEEQALATVGAGKFDLIFVDNRLALWTGPEMLEALRKRGYAGPTVLYTGSVESSNLEQLRELDCHVFLEKGDVTIQTLRSTIQRALGQAGN